jgi:hypothetical protein
MAGLRAAVLLALSVRALSVTAAYGQDRTQPGSATPPVHAKSSLPNAGAINDGVYRNPAFGFSYKVPFGWVDRTADMQDDSAAAPKSRLLLAVFERPPEATGETINSAVVIAAEPLPAGTKTASEYFESVAALTTDKGFQPEGEPHELSLNATKLVRGDFSRARGKLTMRQASLVMLAQGYAISFTFIAGSEDEVEELIEKLSFAARKQH